MTNGHKCCTWIEICSKFRLSLRMMGIQNHLLVYTEAEGKQYHLTEKRHFQVENKTLQKSVGMILILKHQSCKTFQVCFFGFLYIVYTTVTCDLLDFLCTCLSTQSMALMMSCWGNQSYISLTSAAQEWYAVSGPNLFWSCR